MSEKILSHWHPQADYSAVSFFIRRMNTQGYVKPDRAPEASLPLVGFVYITSGEVLIEAGGQAYFCGAGHLLLIPERCPFAILHYKDAVGYTGGFSPDRLHLGAWHRFASIEKALQQAFWFDDGCFASELFNMLALSFERRDSAFIEKGLDLLLSRVKLTSQQPSMPVQSRRFLEMVFSAKYSFKSLSEYARAIGVSTNYLSRQVQNSTGRSPGTWIDIARIGRAKGLLSTTQMPVIDIATAIGLEDQSYFSRFFRKHTGQTPTEYRKLMQGLS